MIIVYKNDWADPWGGGRALTREPTIPHSPNLTVCGKYATICSMRTIDTSTFDFPTLIERKYIYVDKTAQMYELARPDANSIYYLPRPRRFGKSLMISTYKALFQGRRELFKGLAIEKTDWFLEETNNE